MKKQTPKNTKVNAVIKEYIEVFLDFKYRNNTKTRNYSFKESTTKNFGFNSSTDITGEILRVFDKKVSASYIRKIRRDQGIEFWAKILK